MGSIEVEGIISTEKYLTMLSDLYRAKRTLILDRYRYNTINQKDFLGINARINERMFDLEQRILLIELD